MVRRMKPSLVCRAGTPRPATAACPSINFATVAPDSGTRPPDAPLSSLPSSMCGPGVHGDPQ